jgi:hypothetical protein
VTNTAAAAAVVISAAANLITVLKIDNSAIPNYDTTKMLFIKVETNKLLMSGVGRRVQ